jgi:hypothetical protein
MPNSHLADLSTEFAGRRALVTGAANSSQTTYR